jgi:hypothetical protein
MAEPDERRLQPSPPNPPSLGVGAGVGVGAGAGAADDPESVEVALEEPEESPDAGVAELSGPAVRIAGTPRTGSSSGTSAGREETWAGFGSPWPSSVPAVAFPMAKAAMNAATRAATAATRCPALSGNCAA